MSRPLDDGAPIEVAARELQTPLTLLVGSLERALRRDDVPEGLRHELAASARRARRLQQLMDTLLDLSAQEHERLVHVAATDAYRVALTDALRVLDDAAEIQAAASTMLARQLGVSRAYYAGPEAGGLVRVHGDAHQGLPSLAGVYRLTDFGDDLTDGLFSSKTLIVHDLTDLDLDASVRAAWQAVAIAAVITVPFIRDGRWLGTLTVAHHVPRRWTDAEIALVEETAERTWSAIERTLAEQALRDAQEQIRHLTDPDPPADI
jgi:GAF domain-containing protein